MFQRVGLDIGSHTIKGVEVARQGSDIVIRSAGDVPLPSHEMGSKVFHPQAVAQAVASLWASARFETRRVTLSLPAEAVYTKWLNLEVTDEAELETLAHTAAARGAPFPAEDAVIDYRVLSSRRTGSRQTYHVMLVAASSCVMDSLLNAAEAAGLETEAVDIGIVAATRSFEGHRRAGNPLWSKQPRAHALIGARSTTIAVMRGGDLEFARTVPVGGNDFTAAIAEAARVDLAAAERMKVSPDTRLSEDGMLILSDLGREIEIPCEAVLGHLARETLRSLRFFTSQFAEGSYLGMIGGTTLSGGGSLLRGVEEALRRHGIDITGSVNPFAGFSVDADSGGIHQVGDRAVAYTTAVGLAIGDYSSRVQRSAATSLAV